MVPPGGVLVPGEIPNIFSAAESITPPCIETWPTNTGLSGNALSRSSRLSSRPSGMTVSS